MNLEDIQKQIGFGFGTTIGYTNNGTVFVVSDNTDEDGKPMQTITEFTPKRAEEIAKSLKHAAKDARKASKEAH
jgi:hypothetical protein